MPNIKVLVVGGGGGGNFSGGGAGGMVYNSSFSVNYQSYTVTVGVGGPTSNGYLDPSVPSNNGGNSVFSSITAYGGGVGAYLNTVGTNGGSGSGGGYGSQQNGGTGTSGQGNAGGNSISDSPYSSGGGGGAGGAGASGTTMAGGIGLQCDISGSNVYYAGGGGGAGRGVNGTGGSSIGGNGGAYASAGTAGADDTGSGGGACGIKSDGTANSSGGKGGNGIVIISYLTANFGTCTGGTKTTSGSYTIHTFKYADSGTSMTFVARPIKKIAGVPKTAAGIALDSAGNANYFGTSQTLTFSHTCSGIDRLLLVSAYGYGNGTDNISGITYNGTAMTLAAKVLGFSNTRYIYTWYLKNPSLGTNNVVVSSSIPPNYDSAARAVSYTGCLQAGGVDATATATDSGTSHTYTVTTTVDNCWTHLTNMCASENPSAGTGSTRRGDVAQPETFDSNGPKTPAGSTSMTVTTTSSRAGCGVITSFAPSTYAIKKIAGISKP